MDRFSESLDAYLQRMGRTRLLVDHRMEGYIQKLLYLLPPGHDAAICQIYGILGSEKSSLEDVARRFGKTPEEMRQQLEQDLRKLAITPEWQMINPMK
jgi:DNA-directed RNA polymerase sigma subunit (sigma70/sigma32)